MGAVEAATKRSQELALMFVVENFFTALASIVYYLLELYVRRHRPCGDFLGQP